MIFVISAPSGAGKTTLINRLLETESSFMFSISTTTRSRRKGEADGVHYHFVKKEDFCRMIENDEFVEWAEVYGNYYGTTKKEVDRIRKYGKIPLFDVDIQGSRNLKKQIKGGVFVFIIPPSPDVLKKRLVGRKTENNEQLDLRLKNAYNEIAEYVNFDYVIINRDIESAFERLMAIVVAEKCRMKNVKKEIDTILEDFNDYTT
ncbi:MAG TPA: guanylate kinase [Spirochaetota bacterium]|nr:guanylate kinase [Spirochaetota bacterium]